MTEVGAFHYFDSFGDIHFNLFVSPHISLCFNLFFCEGIVDKIGDSIVEVEGIDLSWEEVPESSLLLHPCKDLVRKFIPFLFAVLFVEYAELLVLEPDASETKRAAFHKIRVVHACAPSKPDTAVDVS